MNAELPTARPEPGGWFGIVATVLALGVSVDPAFAKEYILFEDFRPGWRTQWREQRLFSKPTDYGIVLEEGAPVLHATSHAANSCLLREVSVVTPARAQLSWR